MTNIKKERIYLPPTIKTSCNGWYLHVENNFEKVLIEFPKHTYFIREGDYLIIDKYFYDSALFGCLVRKTQKLVRGFALQYIVNLKLIGIGYRVRIENNTLIFRLGFSHEVSLPIPEKLNITLIKYNHIKITGFNYEDIQQFAYKIRSFKIPEPFKGKGIVYVGENVRRKEGKKKIL
jgi:large subunit ribosomal protein L6